MASRKADMNNRIQELVIASGMNKILSEHASEYGNGTIENTPYLELEKFAELIISRCIERCEKIAFKHGIKEDPRSSGKKAGAFECVEDLKEHFGVK